MCVVYLGFHAILSKTIKLLLKLQIPLREAIWRKNQFLFEFLSKGGEEGHIYESKFVRKLFLFMLGTFSGTFLISFGIF